MVETATERLRRGSVSGDRRRTLGDSVTEATAAAIAPRVFFLRPWAAEAPVEDAEEDAARKREEIRTGPKESRVEFRLCPDDRDFCSDSRGGEASLPAAATLFEVEDGNDEEEEEEEAGEDLFLLLLAGVLSARGLLRVRENQFGRESGFR